MKIVIGCDHAGYELKEAIKAKLEAEGYEMMDVGCYSTESVDYPKYGHAVGKAVASGEAEKGIAICGTGIGISIACNKVPGIRAGLVSSVWQAEMTKAHNNANVLCMGGRVVDKELAFEMVDTWLNTEFMGDKHLRRINELEDLDF
ncbi:MAG: ribose 5-phosphate isomerase B [Clostridiales bacterium]|nr:ribose 5-phosphate isomerase B [Clostridiales bacterium]